MILMDWLRVIVDPIPWLHGRIMSQIWGVTFNDIKAIGLIMDRLKSLKIDR